MTYLVYARVSPKGSTWAASETSIPDQVAECQGYITARDPGATVHVIEDEFQSAGSAKRPGYRRLVAELRSGSAAWDVLVVRHLDRLSRSLTDALPVLRLLQEQGKGLVSTTQAIDMSSPTGRAMLHMILVFAEWEREMASERTRAKMVAIAQAGGWPAGVAPRGYERREKHDNTLYPHPRQGPVITDVFERYAAGEPLPEIRKRYSIAKSTMYVILRNPIYVGKLPYAGEVYQGRHEPLVSQATWDQVQARLPKKGQHRAKPGRRKRVFLLAGLVKCHCGRALTPASARGRGGKRYNYYQCTDGAKGGCGYRLRAEILEETIIDMLSGELFTPEDIEQMLELLRQRRAEAAAKARPELQRVETALRTLAAEREKIEQMFLDGIVTAATAPMWEERLARCAAETAAHRGRREALRADIDGDMAPYDRAEDVIRDLDKLGDALARATPENRARIITGHIAGIEHQDGDAWRVQFLVGGTRFVSVQAGQPPSPLERTAFALVLTLPARCTAGRAACCAPRAAI